MKNKATRGVKVGSTALLGAATLKPGLFLVEWLDSAQPLPGWRWLADPPALEVVRCISVGWIVAEDDAVLMLAPNLGDKDAENPQASGHIRIPKRAITRWASLREAR